MAQDECRSWNVNDIVFSRALWPTYHQLMRSDFRLFDEYVFEHEGGLWRDCALGTHQSSHCM